MRIRWNPLQVNEATDVLDGYIDKIVKPLEKAKKAAIEAEQIPKLPDYVKYSFRSFVGEVERVIGGTHSWGNHHFDGVLKSRVATIRRDIPKDALAEAISKPLLLPVKNKTK